MMRERIESLGTKLKAVLAPLLLVLSIAPIALLALPMASDQHEKFERRYAEREAFEVPATAPPPRLDLPAYRAAGIPVLVYHGIDEPGRFSVTREQFARQVAMLAAAGVETITVGEYVAHLRGEPVDLPPRPLLLTFDDGKVSSFQGADAVLERHGMNAVMYAIAEQIDEGSAHYLSADELEQMVSSGRWEVQPHAGEGHDEIAYDAAGNTGPAYAYRVHRDGRLESFAEYKERVLGDIDEASARLADEIDGAGTETFSFPFGAYGQYGTNDRRIPRFLPRALGERFAALFHQPRDARFTKPGADPVLDRFEVRRHVTAGEIGRWLKRNAVPRAGKLSDNRPRTRAARGRG